MLEGRFGPIKVPALLALLRLAPDQVATGMPSMPSTVDKDSDKGQLIAGGVLL